MYTNNLEKKVITQVLYTNYFSIKSKIHVKVPKTIEKREMSDFYKVKHTIMSNRAKWITVGFLLLFLLCVLVF